MKIWKEIQVLEIKVFAYYMLYTAAKYIFMYPSGANIRLLDFPERLTAFTFVS